MKVVQCTLLHNCIIGMEFVTGSIETQWPSDQQSPKFEISVKFVVMKVLQDTL